MKLSGGPHDALVRRLAAARAAGARKTRTGPLASEQDARFECRLDLLPHTRETTPSRVPANAHLKLQRHAQPASAERARAYWPPSMICALHAASARARTRARASIARRHHLAGCKTSTVWNVLTSLGVGAFSLRPWSATHTPCAADMHLARIELHAEIRQCGPQWPHQGASADRLCSNTAFSAAARHKLDA